MTMAGRGTSTSGDRTGPRIGIDLGGSKTEIVALGSAGEELLRRREPTPRGDYRATIGLIGRLVEAAERSLGCTASVGVGIPGSLSPVTGRVRNANSTWLNGQPLDADLARALDRPVRLANDANCLAVSEATDGAGAGQAVVFAAILGTGVGGGIALDGRVLSGRQGIAGEWGHNPLPARVAPARPAPSCWCGKAGCIEAWLSGPALTDDHMAHGGQALDARTIARLAEQGDTACTTSIERYCERLAQALAGVINLLDPDVIVLGGGLSRIDHLYRRLPALLAAHVFSDRCDTPLRPARHGDSSGVRGAAWLW